MKGVSLLALSDIPLVSPGDNLADLICDAATANGIKLADGDILVVAQKIVSKAEGRIVRLADVEPSARAKELAAVTGKDPRLVEVILKDSNEVLRAVDGVLVVEQRSGFICANAGVDHSNVGPEEDEVVALLPSDSDRSARGIMAGIEARTGKRVGVIVNDSHGRAFREGSVGVAIGVAGILPLTDKRGQADLFGYVMRATVVGTADEIAAAASMVMGQTDEGTPVVLVRGLDCLRGEGRSRDLQRPKEKDLFR